MTSTVPAPAPSAILSQLPNPTSPTSPTTSTSSTTETTSPTLDPTLDPTPEPTTIPHVHLHPLSTSTHLTTLRRLNTLLLPIPYPPRFYSSILTSPRDHALTRLAYHRSAPAGAVRARLDPDGRVYIMTLCTLAPFRGLGVGAALVRHVAAVARRWGVGEVYAHVWEENGEALEWYGRRGFERGERVGGYYRRLRPDGAVVVRLRVGAGGQGDV